LYGLFNTRQDNLLTKWKAVRHRSLKFELQTLKFNTPSVYFRFGISDFGLYTAEIRHVKSEMDTPQYIEEYRGI
jgi:hypothetical protein